MIEKKLCNKKVAGWREVGKDIEKCCTNWCSTTGGKDASSSTKTVTKKVKKLVNKKLVNKDLVPNKKKVKVLKSIKKPANIVVKKSVGKLIGRKSGSGGNPNVKKAVVVNKPHHMYPSDWVCL